MKIEQYLRSKVGELFIPLVRKSECEKCGTSENLEVHHVKQFIDMVYGALELLYIEYKPNKEDYSRFELETLTTMLLGIHIRNEYLTLCEECHKENHAMLGKHTIKKKSKPRLHEYTMEEFLKALPMGYIEEPPTFYVECIKEHGNIKSEYTGDFDFESGWKHGKDKIQIQWTDNEDNYINEENVYNPEEDNNILYKIIRVDVVY